MKIPRAWAPDLPGFAFAEQGERLGVDAPVARRDHPRSAPASERAARPVRHDPAGARDHRHQRAEIMQAMAGLDDGIDEAAREQAEGVTVPAPVLHRGGSAHAVETREAL